MYLSNFDTFITAYQSATSDLKAVIDSEAIPTCIRQVVTSQNLDQSHYRELVKLTSLYVLHALDEATLVEQIRLLGVPEARMIFASITSCLRAHPPVVNPTHADLASDIAEVELSFSSLRSEQSAPASTPHTAPASNNQGEPVYTSTQSAILNERRVPTAPTPKWESDN